MSRTVNAGARLDRLPLSSFHRRIFFLIGAGMFFDGYDLYVGTTVLGSTIQSGFTSYGVRGVLALMIGLLIVQIAIVYAWGVEPNQRPLEEMEADTGGSTGSAPRPAPA